MNDNQLKKIIKEAVHRKLRSDEYAVVEPDLFGSEFDTVTIHRPIRVTKAEKEARKQEKKLAVAKAKVKAKEERENELWKKMGYVQGELFGESIDRALKSTLNEMILNEGAWGYKYKESDTYLDNTRQLPTNSFVGLRKDI